MTPPTPPDDRIEPLEALPEAVRRPGEDEEAFWLREVYKPNEPNLTVRAVIVGMLIGGVMCLSNIYVFFKTGLEPRRHAHGVHPRVRRRSRMLQAMRLIKRPLGVLENNALTTVASGAGYMTGGGNMAAFGALLMITTVEPNKVGR